MHHKYQYVGGFFSTIYCLSETLVPFHLEESIFICIPCWQLQIDGQRLSTK